MLQKMYIVHVNNTFTCRILLNIVIKILYTCKYHIDKATHVHVHNVDTQILLTQTNIGNSNFVCDICNQCC